ncbi:MAG TPA: exodeoxyribonuclease VII small subunit [Gammaproteobacteria bacterium]|jgi:exodeoxyribonuclease VII small subunit|nr:exodeoxyribonuclease VII small subunit [Gammaproteobacteria bacterium]HET7586845.1 exodeoxyribonuclease VII small subunit [Gammaproteobacteria bacterium]
MPKKTTSAETAPDFESALKELESVVAALEQGDISLDTALKHFERGVKLTRVCQQALTEAEQKVEILLKDGSVEPFAPEE